MSNRVHTISTCKSHSYLHVIAISRYKLIRNISNGSTIVPLTTTIEGYKIEENNYS